MACILATFTKQSRCPDSFGWRLIVVAVGSIAACVHEVNLDQAQAITQSKSEVRVFPGGIIL